MEKKLGNPEEGDEKVARQALTQEEATGAVTASMGQEERPQKGRLIGVMKKKDSVIRFSIWMIDLA